MYVPAILGPWVQGYFVHIAHIPALLWNQNRVYGQVWDAVVPTNEGIPVADSDFMAVWTMCCIYQPYIRSVGPRSTWDI